MSAGLRNRVVERDRELAVLEAALDDAVAGSGGLVVVEGPAGIGKTTLLQEACRGARERRMVILAASGAETERTHAFGVVRQLLQLRLAGASDAERAWLLSGMAHFAEAALVPDAADARRSSVEATVEGLFWLLANLAERRPVLLAVDDVQWTDQASMRFLDFLARRLAGLPIALIAGARPWDAGTDAAAIGELTRPEHAQRLVLRPFTEKAVADLVGDVLGSEPDAAFVAACATTSGGNPFLLRELLHELAGEGIAPRGAEAARVGRIRPATVARAVLVRLARLPAAAADVARAVAVLERASFRRVAALAGVSDDVADRMVDALVRADVLTAEGRIAYVHPLLRQAVYDQIPPRERARRHAEAARLLAAQGASPDDVAGHLLATDLELDDRDAAILERAAAAAAARGAPETAVACLARVAAHRGDAAGADLLLRLGSAALAAGRPQEALEPLRAAKAQARDPAALAHAARTLAAAELPAGNLAAATAQLRDTIDAIADADPQLVMQLEAELASIGSIIRGISATERLERYAGVMGDTPAERMVLGVLSVRRANAGRLDDAVRLAERALSSGDLVDDDVSLHVGPFMWAVSALFAAGRTTDADRVLERALRRAREHGSALGFVNVSNFRSLSAFIQGDLRAAEAEGWQAFEAARLRSWRPIVPVTLMCLIHTLVLRGADEEAQCLLDETGTDGALSFGITTEAGLLRARAVLRLAQHRPADALADLDMARAGYAAAGWRHRLPPFNWRLPAVRAHLALGAVEAARDVARENLAVARESRSARPLGVALHHLGLAEDDRGRLAEAVDMLRSCDAPLDLAAALADLGAALRRAGRAADARAPLGEAAALADECGAVVLAAFARDELAATGVRRRRDVSSSDELTPSERRIADLAADGLSNKQIAQLLFVTLKTVETHLRNAYRKLGIRSRAGLPAALKHPPAGP